MPLPDEIDVEGHVCARGIRYLGKAAKQPDGKYICLADVGGALCRVEVSIHEILKGSDKMGVDFEP